MGTYKVDTVGIQEPVDIKWDSPNEGVKFSNPTDKSTSITFMGIQVKLPNVPTIKNPNGSVTRTINVLVKDAAGREHKSSLVPEFSHHVKSKDDSQLVICQYGADCFPPGHLGILRH